MMLYVCVELIKIDSILPRLTYKMTVSYSVTHYIVGHVQFCRKTLREGGLQRPEYSEGMSQIKAVGRVFQTQGEASAKTWGWACWVCVRNTRKPSVDTVKV